jgi:hypothetical protein
MISSFRRSAPFVRPAGVEITGTSDLSQVALDGELRDRTDPAEVSGPRGTICRSAS